MAERSIELQIAPVSSLKDLPTRRDMCEEP